MSKAIGSPRIIPFSGSYIVLQVIKGGRDEEFIPISGDPYPALSGNMIQNHTGFRFRGKYQIIISDSSDAETVLGLYENPSGPIHAPGAFFQPYSDFGELIVYGLITDLIIQAAGVLDAHKREMQITIESTNVLDTIPWPNVDRSGWRLPMVGVD